MDNRINGDLILARITWAVKIQHSADCSHQSLQLTLSQIHIHPLLIFLYFRVVDQVKTVMH